MRRIYRVVVVAFLACLLCAGTWVASISLFDPNACQAADERKPDAARDRAILNGRWQGTWLSTSEVSSGYLFFADFQLTVAADNSATGQITWTLKASPHADEQAKIGLTGVEHVQGHFDSRARLLQLEGVRLDDPNIILGLDRYRLLLAENDKVLGGITASQETWLGLISLSRVGGE